MLTLEDSVLIIIDVQGKLAQLMHQKEILFKNIQIVIKGVQALGIPIIWLEQVPDKLGQTIPEVSSLLPHMQPFSKSTFSCCSIEEFQTAFKKLNRKQILILGIETHICVYQSTRDLLKQGLEVFVVADAVSSRTLENKQIGLELMKSAGAVLTSGEAALFEMLKSADHKNFKEIAKIVK